MPSVAIDPIAVDAPKTAHHVHPTVVRAQYGAIIDLKVEPRSVH
jgi:hypothetical protein